MTETTSVFESVKADLGYLQLGRAAECFATLPLAGATANGQLRCEVKVGEPVTLVGRAKRPTASAP